MIMQDDMNTADEATTDEAMPAEDTAMPADESMPAEETPAETPEETPEM